MLIYLGCCAVLAFALAIALALQGVAPAAAAHAAFAVGAMPLVFAAMGHFVPVLTRSGGAVGVVRRLPLVMQWVGLLALGALGGWLPGWVLHGALSMGLLATVVFLVWVLGKGRRALGRPHPGLAWYVAALGCLILALLVIGAGLVWPPAYPLARLAHLHLNTLGFIGPSAIGTLHVLMPTALGRPDSLAAARLTRQLPWMLAGIATAAVAGGLPWLGPVAAVLVGGVVVATLVGWWRAHGWARLSGDGATASLLVASVGLVVLCGAGALHGFALMPGRPAGRLLRPVPAAPGDRGLVPALARVASPRPHDAGAHPAARNSGPPGASPGAALSACRAAPAGGAGLRCGPGRDRRGPVCPALVARAGDAAFPQRVKAQATRSPRAALPVLSSKAFRFQLGENHALYLHPRSVCSPILL
ncbi:MAG: hypothetical protein IPJ73_15685 [Zoogloea sp.]|nr:hypothetical protein [Zoogloea sp.]